MRGTWLVMIGVVGTHQRIAGGGRAVPEGMEPGGREPARGDDVGRSGSGVAGAPVSHPPPGDLVVNRTASRRSR